MNDSDFNYLLSNIGSDVTINDIPARVLILNTKVNSEFDDKKIISKEVLKRGDLVDFDNNKYLVISEVNGDRTSNTYQALIRNTNYNIKFNFAGFIKSFPVILTNQALGLETNKYSITLPSGKMLVYLQENDDTLGITIDQRFIKISNAYTVSGINRSMKGLILLTCDVDTFNANDDKVNEIVDKTDTWSIVITNTTTNIEPSKTLQLTYELKKNDVVVSNPGFIYSFNSSDNSVATIDSNGLITTISNGIATITLTASADANDTLSDSIDITIQDVIQDNYTITITGLSEIENDSTEIYTATVTNNGQVVSEPVTWSVDNYDGIGTIIEQDGISCTVRNDGVGNIILKAVLNKDNNVVGSKEIFCKSLW